MQWTSNRTSVIRNVVRRLGNKDGSPPPQGVFVLQTGRTAEGEDRDAVSGLIDGIKPQTQADMAMGGLDTGCQSRKGRVTTDTASVTIFTLVPTSLCGSFGGCPSVKVLVTARSPPVFSVDGQLPYTVATPDSALHPNYHVHHPSDTPTMSGSNGIHSCKPYDST